ncbi:MAG TPA: hypothetical protein VIT88_02820 [Pyrinomonadaceae bacterium]
MKLLSDLKPQSDLDLDEADFINEFMQLPVFTNKYSTPTNAAQFVTAPGINRGCDIAGLRRLAGCIDQRSSGPGHTAGRLPSSRFRARLFSRIHERFGQP